MGSSHGKFSSNRDESVKASLITKSGLNREVTKGIEDQKEENSSTMRKRLNPRLSRGVPKGLESELVAAGWPKWLVDVASEALIGWLPRTPDTFEKIHKIGQGSYSNVYKARDCLLNKIVVLKTVCADNLDPSSFKFMAREIVLLRRLGDHPNVIKLEGVVPSKMACSLVFDCMEYDLKGIQEQKGVKLSEPEIKCYMNQLLKGLDHCHSRGILHRDVKTSNMLVNKDGILKIADFGLSTFFDPEQSIPLTNIIGTLWYRPPELLLGLNHYGVGVDLWGVGCVLGELFTGKPIMPGKTEFEQLYYIFKLCGSPSDECWLKSDLPNASILKPQMPYRRQIQATFHDLPAAAVGLMDTLLSIEPEYRRTAALALQGEFFTTEPFACDPLSLPRCPPRNEMDAKETKMIREFNAGLQRSVDRRRLRNRLEKTNEKVSGGVLNEGTNSYTQRSATTHQSDNQRVIWKEPIHYHDIKGKKKWTGPSPDESDKMQDLLRECNDTILKAVTHGRLEKGLIAKVNVHDSNGKKSHSVDPSINMQGLPRKHWAMFDKEKKAEGEGNNSKLEKNQLIEQLLPPAESDGLNFLEDNHYCGPLSSTSKPIDVDRILREHDRQIQESVERAKQQKKLVIEATVASGSAVSTTTHVVQFNHVAQLPIKLQGNLNFSTWKAQLVEKLDEARAKQIEDIQCRWLLKEKEEILHTRRRKPNPRLSRGVPKRIEGKIGQGTYSNVYKAHDCLLNKVVALKKVSLDNLDPESVKFMVREIILRRLGIQLEGLDTSRLSSSLYLVFYCMKYDLKGILKHKSVKFSEPEIKCYMHQLLKGLDHCHSRGILHRDITTSNLLVNKDGILKIADFGLSTFFDPEQSIPLTSHIVTLWYRPPELLLGSNSYGVGVDLWGVGCVLGELSTGKPIMPGKTEVEQLHKIFKLCGSPSDDFWQQSKLPNAKIFKPIEPYRRTLHATFHDLPAI
ncbi:hypothetical protein KY285_029910 [Solanum tuberosum]|nr:hypothetical protein KY285_029910 [Solanum tuberosum]